METLFGIVVGVIVTVLVARYYYKLTHKKSLTPYVTLSTRLFSGIDPVVRSHLKFLYHESEVKDIRQLEFLIANDGERAIANCIEPLSLEIPATAAVLDATIVHKHPFSLKVSLAELPQENGGVRLECQFPLLNKGDFFLLKILVSGEVNWRTLAFSILVDDLPRILLPKPLPLSATKKDAISIDWAVVSLGLISLTVAACLGYGTYLIWTARPELFPYPMENYNYSTFAAFPAGFWMLATIFSGLIGILALLAGVGLEDIIRRRRRFPLPDEYRHTPPWLDLKTMDESVEVVDRLSK